MHDAFLKAIAEHPDDDADRLVYADWLDEQGEVARAEFIRLQCALARDERDKHLGPGERLALKEREKELIAAHGREWAGEAAVYEPEFRRGFVERVTLYIGNGRAAMERLQALRAEMPTIAGLKVSSSQNGTLMRSGWMRDMLNHEACRGLRELDLQAVHLYPQDVGAVARAGRLALERLNLSKCGIGRWDEMEALALSPHMGRLKRLDLSDNGPLQADPWGNAAFPRLEVLNLERSGLSGDDLRFISNAPFMRHLRQLELGGNARLGDNAVRILAASAQPFMLRRLGLSGCVITDDGVAALTQSRKFSALESLSLGFNRIGPAGARGLAAAENLGKLQSLDLRDCNIGAAGKRALEACTRFEEFRHLDISRNGQPKMALKFGEGASSAVGAVGKMTLGMRAQLEAGDSRHVTVRE